MDGSMQSSERRERFDDIFAACYDPLLAYARRRVDSSADDVVAETLTIAWRRLDELPPDPLPWLFGVARRVIASDRRGEGRRLALLQRLASEGSPPHQGDRQDANSALLAALATLGEADREALLLVAWDELTPQRAAAALGCSAVAFRVRLHRARRRLRGALSSVLSEQCAPCDVHQSVRQTARTQEMPR
jgi:RNA polymerase sigma-70 factor (ECF subfamily)